MRIQLDENTGRCIGYGDQPNWNYSAPVFLSLDNFNNWVCHNPNDISNILSWTEVPLPVRSDPFEKVKSRIAIGEFIKLRFLSENASVTISPQDNQAQLTAFKDVITLLDVGDLKSALTVIQYAVPDSIFVLTPGYNDTAARKQSYIDQLTTAVADLFE